MTADGQLTAEGAGEQATSNGRLKVAKFVCKTRAGAQICKDPLRISTGHQAVQRVLSPETWFCAIGKAQNAIHE